MMEEPIGMTDLAGLRRIQEFAAEYCIRPEGQPATPAQQSLIEDALIDYLLVEEYIMGPAKERVRSALESLNNLSRLLPPIAKPTVKLLEQTILDLSGRLERREEANDINFENLMMMSERISQMEERPANELME